MQAGDIKLGNLFLGNHRYVIPIYQRPYVWTADRNWQPLWDDISSAADDLLYEMEREEWTDEPLTYFLGSIVVQGRPGHPQQLSSSMLVDGQQRLTTLQVLLAAARQVAHDCGADSAVGRFAEWIDNSDRAVHDKYPNDRHKLWPLPQDRDEYLWAVRPPQDNSEPPNKSHALVQARAWYTEAISTWAHKSGDPATRLDALHSALETRIELVRITLEKTDNAQVIFEALNHRGVELSQADLVKNLLFRLVYEQEDERTAHQQANKLLIDYWLPLDGADWRKSYTTGRIKRSQLDLLISYWLTARRLEVITADNVFDALKSWVLKDRLRAEPLIKDIRRTADLFDRLQNNPPDDETAALIDLILATNTSTWWPLILEVWGDDRILVTQRQAIARTLMSYLVRRMICDSGTKQYNRLIVTALRRLRQGIDDGQAADEVLTKHFAEVGGSSQEWPSDEAFRRHIRADYFYSLTQARQRVFFAGIENWLRRSMSDAETPIRAHNKHLNIEHVLPQSWESHWPLSSDSDEGIERREAHINQVGNLTLVNGRLNTSMKNGPWEKKKEALRTKSTLLITTASILSDPRMPGDRDGSEWATDWDEDRISMRSRYLADLALQVWSRPSVAAIPIDQYDEMDDADDEEHETDDE